MASHVYDGQVVWAPMREFGGWLRCTVQTAMGDTARVVNEARDVDTWFHIGELQVDKPQGRIGNEVNDGSE